MDMLNYFASEYNEEQWSEYAKCFDETEMRIEGIPQDIVNAVMTILGNEEGYKWLHFPLHKFDGKSAVDLLKTVEGEKALKAFIMRIPN